MKPGFDWTTLFHNRLFVVAVFGTAPVLNFMAQNAIDPKFLAWRSAFYCLVIIASSYVITLALDAVFRRRRSLFFAFLVGLTVFATLNGYHIANLVFGGFFAEHGIQPRSRYVLLIYVVLLSACLGLSYGITRRKALISVVLAVISTFVIVDGVAFARSMFVVLQAEETAPIASHDSPRLASARQAEGRLAATPGPNVYLIIPDMMVGREIFAKFGAGSEIFAELSALGFDSIEKPYANAPVTAFSLPHLFGMDYVFTDAEQVTKLKRVSLDKSLRDNRVYLEFKNRGYRIVAINDGYYGHCGLGEHLCIRKGVADIHRLHDIRFLERTPFKKPLNDLDMIFNIFDTPVNLWPFPNRMEMPDIISSLGELPEGPNFVYIHYALPHYPFRFAEDCSYRRFDDVSLGYAHQLRCATKTLPRLARAIVTADPEAIIVIQSDHGISIYGQHLKPVSELSDAELRENLSIFSAFRLPDRCREHLRPGLTPVNTFRLIFACLDGRTPDLLEDRMFAVYYLRWPSGGKVREWRPRQ